ncbi:MAG: FAD-binding oxidoreductase [Eggerthellaceae bacterium]
MPHNVCPGNPWISLIMSKQRRAYGGKPYRPWPARITSITDLTATEKLFEFRLIDERIRSAFHQDPGQFVELSIFGVGEAPISISSAPSKQGFIELCVRRAGRFTEVLHAMQCGDVVGIRGPFGRGFPFEEMKGHDIPACCGRPGHRAVEVAYQLHS